MVTPLVVLLTDFGLKDHYVGVMKGVMKDICPHLSLIDLTHEISPQDVKEGAYVLGVSYRYFPPGAVFLAVVDPGVGTERKPLALKAGDYFFVGPDNGLFTLVLKQEREFSARLLSNHKFFRPKISETFHGRDIFAPVAAHLACGAPFSALGPELKELVLLPWPEPRFEGRRLIGAVVHVDRFGNLITNISEEDLSRGRVARVLYRGLEIPFLRTYGLAQRGEALCLIGSDGFLEIAVAQGSAAEKLGARGEVRVEFSPE